MILSWKNCCERWGATLSAFMDDTRIIRVTAPQDLTKPPSEWLMETDFAPDADLREIILAVASLLRIGGRAGFRRLARRVRRALVRRRRA